MADGECIVFYSWASDHPNNTNRSLIETALERAVRDLHSDETIKVVPVIDRDTKGVPGSPDIASTIFNKIDQAQVFVCDVSIVDSSARRPSPNPNVLIELGYALKKLGHERIIMVMNTAFGELKLLPFDLQGRRTAAYSKPEDTNDEGAARKELQSKLTEALRTILQGLNEPPQGELIQPRTPAQIAQESIEATRPDMDERARQYMEWLGEQVDTLTPKRLSDDQSQQSQWEEDLLSAIDASAPLVLEFTQLAQTAVAYKAAEALNQVYEGFSHILDLYNTPRGFSGSFMVSDFDLPRFIGHETFVTFCALLLRGKKWDTLADLLSRDIYVTNDDHHEAGTMSYNDLSEYLRLLDARNTQLKLSRKLLHADILKERHAPGGVLAQALPFALFMDADYFLYLRGQLTPDTATSYVAWRPWSSVYLNNTPRFLAESTSKAVAEPLARVLGVPSAEELRNRLSQRDVQLMNLFNDPFFPDPLRNFNPASIGTR